ACANGMIVGGTSIWGGLGQKPSEKEAKLFIWDPVAAKKVSEIAPVPNAPALTGLFVGPDGNAWGMAGGTLFIFDVAKREITFRKKLFDVEYAPDAHVWREANFVLHPSGAIYGTMRGKLFRLDAATKEVQILRDGGADLLALDRDGRVYFRDGSHLWQY